MTLTPLLTLAFALAPGHDWPHWLGPARDGVSIESEWASTGRPEPVWTRQLGPGYSNVSIAGGRLFTAGYDEEAEEDVFWCLDPQTGAVLWSHRYAAAPLANYHGGGTLTTPTVDGEVVYAVNRFGHAFARAVADGEVLWERDYTEEFGLEPNFHGFSASPLALADELIVVLGGNVMSVAKDTGEVRWRTEDYGDGGYANPASFVLRGKPVLAIYAGLGLLVLDLDGGEELHRLPWRPKGGGINAATPIVMGERVFISSAYDQGCALVELGEGPEPAVLWKNGRMRCKVGDVLLFEDHLYGFDESMLKCLDLEGKERWRVRGLGMGTLAIAGGRLMILSSKGDLIVAEATHEEFRELSRAKVLQSGGVSWTPPVLVDGLMYCRSSLGELVCRDHRIGAAATAAASSESVGDLPAAADLFAAHVAAIGGEEALRKPTSYRAVGEIEILGAGITRNAMTIERMAPDRWHLTYETGEAPVHRGYDGEIGWQLDPFYGDFLYEGDQLKELRETLAFQGALAHAGSYSSATTSGAASFGDRPCWVVDAVTVGGTARRLYFDRETDLLVGREGPTESMVVHSDYARFGDLLVPTVTAVLIPDTGAEETYFVREISFDVVDASAFERPEKVLRLLRTPEEIEAENAAAREEYAELLGAYVADFEPHDGAHFTVVVEDGGLGLDVPGQQVYALLPPDANGRWLFVVTDTVSVVFLRNDEGAIRALELTTRSGPKELPRVEPVEEGGE